MLKLKALLNNQWFFPIVMLYYGIFYISFGETFPLNGGVTMDGVVFSTFVSDFKKSHFFDTFYVHRILPSLIVGGIFKLFLISPTNPHIFTSFQILNLAGIITSCYFLKRIFVFFNISLKNQLLGFTLFLVNFAMLKFPFYLPVMSDTLALAVSTMMLFFYLKNNTFGVICCTIAACFTWQPSFYQGLILTAFPYCYLPFSPIARRTKLILRLSAALSLILICLFIIFIKKMDTASEHVARINRTLLPLSILGASVLYFFFSNIFLNSNLLNIRLFLSKLKLLNFIYTLCIWGASFAVIYYLNPFPNKFYPLQNTLFNPFLSALVWPLHTLVSHTAFWGMLVILLIFFWGDFCRFISQMGWGLVGAFALNLFLFGLISETRCLTNLLPWLIVFLANVLNKYSFSKSFYIITALLCFATSKIWLLLNNNDDFSGMQLDKNFSMGFPHQKFWMNIGPWMSQQMYYLQGGGVLLLLAILFFMFYKIEVKRITKVRVVRRY